MQPAQQDLEQDPIGTALADLKALVALSAECCRRLDAEDFPSTFDDLIRGVEAGSRSSSLALKRWADPADDQVRRLAEAVARSPALHRLRLTHTRVSPERAAWLSDAFASNASLATFVMAENCRFTDETALTTLARGFARSTTLVCVELSMALSDADAVALAQVVARNSNSLMMLDLRYNRISDDGATELGKLLMASRSLEEIDVRNNPRVTPRGLAALQRARTNLQFSRPTLALLGSRLSTTSTGLDASTFISRKDGDHAIWSRVVGFLVEDV